MIILKYLNLVFESHIIKTSFDGNVTNFTEHDMN